jgi:phosphohistidine phosphatase
MPEVFAQAGALAYRTIDNTIQVLLITTSSGKHLTIPKGLIDPGFSATETVRNEAVEEAGIAGRLLVPPVGIYHFDKWGGHCEVEVYAMQVTRQLNRWPEGDSRRRLWVDFRQAAQRVKYAQLGALILELPEYLVRHHSGK